MKTIKHIILLLAAAIAAVSCDKDEELKVSAPSFRLLPLAERYTAGEPVRFGFEGDADMLMFYSGEKGDLQMSFSSQCRYGNYAKNVYVMASSDFSGQYTEEAILAATWTDITDRFTFASNTTMLPSGAHSISDIIVPDRPLYLAFRYKGEVAPGASDLSNWWIQDFSVDFIVSGVSSNIAAQVETDWNFVNFEANAPAAGWAWNTDGKRIQFTGQKITTPAEGWAIPTPIDVYELKVPGAPIKAYIDPPIRSYEYTYTEPGTYEIRFEAVNASSLGSAKVVQTATIIVEEATEP